MNRPSHLLLAVAGAIAVLAVPAQGVIVEQQNFSLGYGYQIFSIFTTNETASANTPTTAPNPDATLGTFGGFSFSVSAPTASAATAGPTFPNRVLSDGVTDYSGQSSNFTVTFTMTYTGSLAGLKDPSVSLVIDQISIWGLRWPGDGLTNEMFWTESTPGHAGVSPSVYLLSSTAFGQSVNYTQLAWNPADWEVYGETNVIRTFNLPAAYPFYGNYTIDGLEFLGHFDLLQMVPEPSTVVLLGVGGLAWAWWRRRRQRPE